MQAKGSIRVIQENNMLIASAMAEGELASDVGSGAGRFSFICWWDKVELDAFARAFRPVAEEGR